MQLFRIYVNELARKTRRKACGTCVYFVMNTFLLICIMYNKCTIQLFLTFCFFFQMCIFSHVCHSTGKKESERSDGRGEGKCRNLQMRLNLIRCFGRLILILSPTIFLSICKLARPNFIIFICAHKRSK